MPTKPGSRDPGRSPDPDSPAQLRWDRQGLPLSGRFNDFYFSRADGLAETHYVFLQHNQLPQRWQALSPEHTFTIAETGFGTGLNFLASWQSWAQHSPAGARLHFVSVERYPLDRSQLHQALALWPQLAEQAEQLLDQYPSACHGVQRLRFDHGRVCLTLIFDDACHGYQQFDGKVDAWYLDGFTPDKNPQMWSAELFDALASCSTPGTTFSTFTAASDVRRSLQASHFQVKRAKGFGKKREMLYGQYQPPSLPPSHPPRPWFGRPSPARLDSSTPICIIGAGLAGASCAFALAQRGHRVSLFERGAEPGCGASGNPQGVLYAKLPARPTVASRIHLNGYLYSLRLLSQQLQTAPPWSPCGVLQLALDPRQANKHQALLAQAQYPPALVHGVTPEQASQLAGYPLRHGGLFYPDAGWVSPADLCRQLLDHPNIESHFNQPITSIDYDCSRQHWQLHDSQSRLIASSAVLVVANAQDAEQFPQLEQLPLKPIRGQTSSVTAASTTPLQTVLCGNGYIAPARHQRFCFGASFDLGDLDHQVRQSDHHHNLELVRQLCPELARQLESGIDSAQGRVGFRCAAPDYLPIVGAVADPDAFIEAYAQLGKDARARIDTPATHLDGLFVSLGHGSKGLITAPLAGELLADLILGTALPLEQDLADALNPGRFIIKKLIKGTI